MESKLIEIELLDLEDSECFSPFVYIRISDGKTESKDFFAKIDTGADLTLIPQLFVEDLGFTLYSSSVDIRWGNGDISKSMTPWTGFVKFSNSTLLKSTGLLFIEGEKAFLGMDILRQGTLFLTPKGGYFLIQ